MFAHIFGDVVSAVGEAMWQAFRQRPKQSCSLCKGRGDIGDWLGFRICAVCDGHGWVHRPPEPQCQRAER